MKVAASSSRQSVPVTLAESDGVYWAGPMLECCSRTKLVTHRF